jgi:hypothetical protein
MKARETSPGDTDRGARLTVEIETILVNEELAALLEAAEASGQLRQVELVELLEPLELDPLELEAVYLRSSTAGGSSSWLSRRRRTLRQRRRP